MKTYNIIYTRQELDRYSLKTVNVAVKNWEQMEETSKIVQGSVFNTQDHNENETVCK